MLDGDLGYTCFMTTTFKGRIKESCEDSLDLLFGDEACRDREDVRIVMLTSEFANSTSQQRAARTLEYLFMTIEIPLPDPQTDMPRASSPDSIACPMGWA